ncbi:MAG: 3-phosphoshikimate 1-carboxyvinyltransferase [Bacteroidota bacterium]
MNHTVAGSPQLRGSITPPPDKSIAQRSAIFGLLHEGTSVIKNYSPAQDPQSALKGVQQLGARVEEINGELRLTGVGRNKLITPLQELDCGNSGTAMRLLSGVIAGSGLSVRLVGDASLTGRTMKRIIDPLEAMGAHILARNSTHPPLHIDGARRVQAVRIELPIPSAQLKSCILLAGLFGEEPTTVLEPVPSRDHTERLLQLSISEEGGIRAIQSSREDGIPAQSYTIPSDFSAAAFWLVAGSIHPDAELLLPGTGLNPTRSALLTVLKEMGADITIENEQLEGAEPVGDLYVRSSALKGIEIPESIIPNCIDELPIISVAACFAEGSTVIRGAGELRHKETDRIMAIAHLLNAAGVRFEEFDDGLIIHGDPEFSFHSATFQSFHDHRIAMAAAVLSLMGKKESTIRDAESAAVSYPGFWEDLKGISH